MQHKVYGPFLSLWNSRQRINLRHRGAASRFEMAMFISSMKIASVFSASYLVHQGTLGLVWGMMRKGSFRSDGFSRL